MEEYIMYPGGYPVSSGIRLRYYLKRSLTALLGALRLLNLRYIPPETKYKDGHEAFRQA